MQSTRTTEREQAQAHERYRCALINHRLKNGYTTAELIAEFGLTAIEIDAAIEQHNSNMKNR